MRRAAEYLRERTAGESRLQRSGILLAARGQWNIRSAGVLAAERPRRLPMTREPDLGEGGAGHTLTRGGLNMRTPRFLNTQTSNMPATKPPMCARKATPPLPGLAMRLLSS